MAKLLLFVPCERVIVEHGSNGLSLISVIQGLTVVVPADLPQGAKSPQRWYVLAMWLRDEAEKARWFRQRLLIEGPTGNQLLEVLTDFEITKETHRVIATIDGFPIGQPGRYLLRLLLQADGTEGWQEVADFPITLTHAPALPVPSATA
jgi:hypothetical protein